MTRFKVTRQLVLGALAGVSYWVFVSALLGKTTALTGLEIRWASVFLAENPWIVWPCLLHTVASASLLFAAWGSQDDSAGKAARLRPAIYCLGTSGLFLGVLGALGNAAELAESLRGHGGETPGLSDVVLLMGIHGLRPLLLGVLTAYSSLLFLCVHELLVCQRSRPRS